VSSIELESSKQLVKLQAVTPSKNQSKQKTLSMYACPYKISREYKYLPKIPASVFPANILDFLTEK